MEQERYLSELSKCVRCGSCKALCPTYDELSMEGTGARGRMVLLYGLSSGQLKPSPILLDRIFSCTLCGACSGLCPAGVDIKELIFHGRSVLRRRNRKKRLLGSIAGFCINRPRLSFKALSMGRHTLLPYLNRRDIIPFKPDIPDYFLTDRQQVFSVSNKRGRVAIFTGCAINFLYPHLGESLIAVLQKLGYEVILPAGEICCGSPLRGLGLEEMAARSAEKNISIFSKLNVEAVLSLCPTCTLNLKVEYPKLIGKGIEKAADISTFLLDKIESSQLAGVPSQVKTALYHVPCHLKYGLGIEKEPKEVLRKIGIDPTKTPAERCCGFAGAFCFSHKKLSKALLHKCTEDYAASKAEAIVTSCPGCILQLTREIKDRPVLHLIELIEEAMFSESRS